MLQHDFEPPPQRERENHRQREKDDHPMNLPPKDADGASRVSHCDGIDLGVNRQRRLGRVEELIDESPIRAKGREPDDRAPRRGPSW